MMPEQNQRLDEMEVARPECANRPRRTGENSGRAGNLLHGVLHVRRGRTVSIPIPPLAPDDVERLWAKIERRGPIECWPWTGAAAGGGYGRFKVAGRSYSPHRIVYELANGEQIPRSRSFYHGFVVRHSCDNPACCNPAHLVLGTQAENVGDMVDRGRKHTPRAEEHWWSRFSDADIEAIRTYPASSRKTALAFGCSDSYVRDLRRGKTRRSATLPNFHVKESVRPCSAPVQPPDVSRVAALFVAPDGVYSGLPDVDVWDQARDARTYAGPWPVVAHPPCQLWGSFAFVNFARYGGDHNRPGNDDGCFAAALAAVRQWGGVLEHPASSRAWGEFGIVRPKPGRWCFYDGLWVAEVWQSAYGHKAQKRTWLCYRGDAKPQELDWRRPEGSHQIGFHDQRGPDRNKPTISGKAASATPEPFRDVLLSIARAAAKAQQS